jgi:hypothetical protein
LPLLFIALGVFFLIAAVRGGDHLETALTTIKGDFTGENSFFVWMIALFVVGAIGYVPKLKPFSVAMLTLVLLSIFLSNSNGENGGFFVQFNKQVLK